MQECIDDQDPFGDVCGAGDLGESTCQNYNFDGFNLCCPEGIKNKKFDKKMTKN